MTNTMAISTIHYGSIVMVLSETYVGQRFSSTQIVDLHIVHVGHKHLDDLFILSKFIN